MKKSLVALAVGAAFAAPAAFADVTISGAINMGIEYLDVDDSEDSPVAALVGNQGDGTSNFGISNNYSNVTISSVDDLGGGLKLDFAFQIQTANDDGGGTLTNRNSHIGLVSESWGGVWYGANENIYERYFYSIDPLDGAAGLGGNLQIMGNPGGQVACNQGSGCYSWYRRDDNVIWYDSPSFGGFTFGVVWGTDDDRANEDKDPMMWQVGAKWAGTDFPLQLWGAYGNRSDQDGLTNIGFNASSDTDDDSAFQLGVGFTLGDIFLFANYERLEYTSDDPVASANLAAIQALAGVPVSGVEEWSRDAYGFGVKWNLASGYLGAQFVQALDADCEVEDGDCDDFADDTAAYMIGVGYYHNLSKQTQAYIVGSYIDNAENAFYNTAGISNGSQSNVGAEKFGVGVGLKHSF